MLALLGIKFPDFSSTCTIRIVLDVSGTLEVLRLHVSVSNDGALDFRLSELKLQCLPHLVCLP